MPRLLTLTVFQSAQFVQPAFAITSQNGTQLPPPLEAVDGSFIPQHLIMLSFSILETDVSFHFEIKAPSRGSLVCPQYLVVAR